MENPWAWTWTKANANMMAIESRLPWASAFPTALGNWMVTKTENKALLEHRDHHREASQAALVDFFVNKFPELKEGGFYIAGE